VAYILCFSAHNARACSCVLNARVCVHLLIFVRIISKASGYTLLLTLSVKDYVLFMFTRREYAFECACARACVIKHSLIYGPIAVKTFTYLWTDSLQICWAHTTDDHKLRGLHNYHVHAPGAHA
jgi:hypothetical protein